MLSRHQHLCRQIPRCFESTAAAFRPPRFLGCNPRQYTKSAQKSKTKGSNSSSEQFPGGKDPVRKVASAQTFSYDIEKERKMKSVGRQDARTDLFQRRYPVLDHHIPTTWWKSSDQSTVEKLSESPKRILRNWKNRFSNAQAMLHMKREFALSVEGKRPFMDWLQIFHSTSVKPSAWISPVRETLLKNYLSLNEAIAKNDLATISKLSAYDFQDHLVALAKKRKPELTFKFKYHGDVAPCQVVSIRSVLGYMAPEPPKFGSRILVQALVRFETLQSVEVFNQKGQLLRLDGTVARPGDPPASPKTVLDYYVFENKFWMPHGWIARDQLFEGVEGKYLHMQEDGKIVDLS
ncbi:hypothetical protein BD410DRAFT_828188 [Rickenella mellea]|uniref:Tim44-like domain-containing protein n=1 Tax=Rickenella mellea TaxID=50990 RepID=A0A4Y7Q7E2_9AGAM|nr:hypothetical protein BD410DRAFT_828188 [Rickenella mellea]